MRPRADYHIHSTYSKNNHGKSTIEQIVKRAVEIGLKEIAITDHGPAHYLYGIKRSKILEAKNEVKRLRKIYKNITILFGVEANIIGYDGSTDIDEKIMNNCDIILCGYHAGVLYKNPIDAFNFLIMNKLCKFSEKLKCKMIEKNTKAIVNALNNNRIDILTHPGDKILVDIDKIAKAAEKNGTILEINNSHNHLNTEEIKIASKYNIKFSINSDAHRKENIGNYKKGFKSAINAGLELDRIINFM